MEKKAVVTIVIGEHAEKIAAITTPHMVKYARKCGADFIEITKPVCGSAHWAKTKLFELLERFDRVLYVDNDVLITPDAPDIFEAVPETHIGAFLESRFVNRIHLMNDYLTRMEYTLGKSSVMFNYLNTGVLVVPKRWRHIFESPGDEEIERNIQFKKDHWNSHFHDQSFFNWRVNLHGADVFDIGPKFNWMDCMDDFSKESRYDAHFIHYAGLGKCMKAELLDQIKKDIKKLGADSHGEEADKEKENAPGRDETGEARDEEAKD